MWIIFLKYYSCFCFPIVQIQFRAIDNGNPAKSSPNTVTGTISIYRNDNPPVFVPQDNYVRFVDEAVPAGTFVIDLNATDADFNTLRVSWIF